MKTKMSSPKILNIVLCIVILLIFVLTIGIRINAETFDGGNNASEVIPLRKQVGYKSKELSLLIPIIDEKELEEPVLDLTYYINEYEETIKFFSKAFDYKYEDIINDLYAKEKNNESFEYTNIGYLKDKDNVLKVYPSFEYGLIEYFYNLNNSKSKLRKVKYVPYEGNASYVENLIIYYANIYSNVDAVTLLSIGASESGYYKVKYMLKYNNVYGGMSSKGLIKHNNIEQGVLSYVRMMAKNYYGKGLKSLEAIGRVYCPVSENGVKKASPHWINLVNAAKNKYSKMTNTITINEIISNEERI